MMNKHKADTAPATQSEQHTPGPWTVDGSYIRSETEQLIADLSTSPWMYGEAAHNARLIAAAPDLLQACKMALARFNLAMANDHSTGSESGIRAQHVRQLEDAIAKAQGSKL